VKEIQVSKGELESLPVYIFVLSPLPLLTLLTISPEKAYWTVSYCLAVFI